MGNKESTPGASLRLGVMGAGAIGGYLGGRLAASGADVVLIGRPSLGEEIKRCGLRLTDFEGGDVRLPAERVRFEASPAALGHCDVVLVTVKGLDTVITAKLLAAVLRPEALVVSLQNGVSNPERLRANLAGRRVLAGMVPFNVQRRESAHFHRGTRGALALERHHGAIPLTAALRSAGIPVRLPADIRSVIWGKLLVNLNNSVNALAGVPLVEMMAQRGYRRVMAACLREALAALKAARIRPRLEPPLPPKLMLMLLSMSDGPFGLLAPRLVKLDPDARSSMADDLARGRKTEIDDLNGEIVRLAAAHGQDAKVNRAIVGLVKQAEGGAAPRLAAEALEDRLAASL